MARGEHHRRRAEVVLVGPRRVARAAVRRCIPDGPPSEQLGQCRQPSRDIGRLIDENVGLSVTTPRVCAPRGRSWEAPRSVGSNGETVFRLKGERAFEVDVWTFNRRCRLL